MTFASVAVRLYAFMPRTSDNVQVRNNLTNGSHLEIDEAIELLVDDTQLAPRRPQTCFSAGESDFAHFDRQLSDFRANALCHRPAMTRYRVEILRHPVLPRFRLTELGRIVRMIGSAAQELSTDEIRDVSLMPRQQGFRIGRLEIRTLPPLRPIVAAHPEFHVRRAGAMKMSVCYIHNDVDAERCRISLREKSPVTLFTLDSRGRVVWLSGVVQSINRALGGGWRVEIDLATVASTDRGRKTRQRAP
jgi:hypothetical protein